MLRWAGEPITPRACIFGGRVECFMPYMNLTREQISSGYRGEDIDFVSMYPAVQKSMLFPTRAHPRIIQHFEIDSNGFNWGMTELQRYFGIFSAYITLPRGLYISPLPFRCPSGRIVFGLCRGCIMSANQEGCSHRLDMESGFHVILNSVDLELAVEYGAKVHRVYEIWDYGRETLTTDMFSGVVNVTPSISYCSELCQFYGFSVSDQGEVGC